MEISLATLEKYCKEINLIHKDWMLIHYNKLSDNKTLKVQFLPKWENSVKPIEHEIEIGDVEMWIRDKKIESILK